MKRRAFLVATAFTGLAIVWTRPLAFYLSSRLPHDPGDPVFNAWLLWWNAHAVPFTTRWWNPPVFFPMPGALALSEHLAGLAVITTPVQLAGGNPVAAYNTAFILSFALSAWFAFLLTRELLRRTAMDPPWRDAAALCAALAYGFGPYRAGQLAHLQVLTSQWMPLALLAMHRFLDAGRRRWLAVFAFAWIVQALSNGYYLLFFPVLLAMWWGWFIERRHSARGLALVGCWAAASLLLVPPLVTYAGIQKALGLARTSAEISLFSAKPDSFLRAPAMLAFWQSGGDAATTEEFLFPGLTVIALIVCGSVATAARRRPEWTTRRSPLIFYVVAALVTCMFTFEGPYSLLAAFPGYSALRVPARFAMLASLCAAVAAGLSFAVLLPRAGRYRWGLLVIVVAGLVIDGWMRPMPLATPPGRMMLPPVRDALVLELPADEGIVDVGAMYRQTQHAQPIVNGYSGHVPSHFRIFSMALRRGDASVIPAIAAGRPLVISVHGSLDRDGAIRRLVDGLPGIDARGGSGGGSIFVLPPSPVRRVAPEGAKWPATIGRSADSVVLDLGDARIVRTIGFALRWRYAELATRLTVDASVDGTQWTKVSEEPTGAAAVSAALADPVTVPVRLTLPDVKTRYVRVHPAPAWMERELAAFAPR